MCIINARICVIGCGTSLQFLRFPANRLGDLGVFRIFRKSMSALVDLLISHE